MERYQNLDDSYQLRHLFRFYTEGEPWWDADAIRQWLVERWGEPGEDNVREFRYTHWGAYARHMTVIIRDDVDAIEFKLRWWGVEIENPQDHRGRSRPV